MECVSDVYLTLFYLSLLVIICRSEEITSTTKEPTVHMKTITKRPNSTVEVAQPGEYPYMVSFEYLKDERDKHRTHFCTGALVDESFVVTSAECMTLYPPDEDAVYLVAGMVSINDPNAMVRTMAFFKSHPDYTPETHDNDIAIVKSKEKFVWNKLVQPVHYRKKPIKLYHTCVLSSWGIHDDKENNKKELLLAETTLINEKQCSKHKYFQRDRMLCVTNLVTQEMCDIGAGSPVVCEGFLSGIWHHTTKCSNDPELCTSVFYYYDWIDINIYINRSSSVKHFDYSLLKALVIFIVAYNYFQKLQ